jgi:hypothetical protein
MVIAKRIMDICNPDQILVDKNTVDQIRQLSRDYLFKRMGKYKIKHGEEVEVYRFVYSNKEISKNMFGNKINITIGKYDPIACASGEKYSD